MAACFAKIQNLNLNGVAFADFEREVEALAALPSLRSLYANLKDEGQVDIIMKTLVDLEFLNGLPVEREYLEEPDSFGTDDESEQESGTSGLKGAGSIREVPEEDSDGS